MGPDIAGGEREARFLAEPAAEVIERLREVQLPFAGVDALQVGRDLAEVALLVGDEFLDELLGRPVGEGIGDLEIVAIGGEQRGLQHRVETGGNDERIGRV